MSKEKNWKDVEVGGYFPMQGLEQLVLTDDTIPVFEGYYHDKNGGKRKVEYSPMLPTKVLSDTEWKWADGTDRRWPVIALTREDRSEELLDSRGFSEMTKDNQLAATQFKNMRGMLVDYFAIPMFEGTNPFSANQFQAQPGATLPEGIKPIFPPDMSTMFGFSIDEERTNAARRSGSEFGAQSGRQSSKDPITATESNRQALNADLVSMDAVARFTEPLSEMFSMMWEWLRHMPVPLPVISQADGGFITELDEKVYNLPFLVKSAANARNSDPIFLLNQLLGLLPFLTQSTVVDQGKMMQYVLNQIDPTLSDRLVTDVSQGAPIDQAVVQLAEQIAGLSDIVKENRDYITAEIQEEEAQEQEGKDDGA